MKVIIIEDEQPNADLLGDYIKDYNSEIQIVATLKSKDETKKWFQENSQEKIDLVFSDIELLDGNVFSMLKENLFSCPIIFTTAYNDFYQEAFDANGISYLLKPISFKKFATAMEKFERLSQPQVQPEIDWQKITELIHQKPKTYKERIVIKNAAEIHILNTKNTIAILSNCGKLMAVDSLGKQHEFRYKLADLSEELNPKVFFQINRGEIVNINYIEKIEPYFGDRLSIKLKNYRTNLITSASVTPDFRKWLE